MKQLIVTADDVGLHESINSAVIRAHREGIVTACSIVANGAAFDDAVDRLHAEPRISVGVHLTFVEEMPLLARVSTLTDANGRFVKNYRRFAARLFFGGVDLVELEQELRAQIERVLATGLRIDHLNGHQHLHLLSGVFDIVVRLAFDYRIGFVRIVNDRGGRASLLRTPQIHLLNTLGAKARSRVKGRAQLNDFTIGVREAGHLDSNRIVKLFDEIDGVTELVCHPGDDDAALAAVYPTWRYSWRAEADALANSALREELDKRTIRLTSHRRLLDIPTSESRKRPPSV